MILGGTDELATRSSRLVAAMIDGLIGLFATVPIMFATGYFERVMRQQVSVLETVAAITAGVVIYILIHGYLLATRGQTIGKMVLGVRIVDFETNHLLPLGKLIGLRLLPITVGSALPLIGGVVGLTNIFFIFQRQRRCIHDLIAGTKVVQAAAVPALRPRDDMASEFDKDE